MRKLSDGTNIDGATADYPNGRVRDKLGAVAGSIYDEVLNGDIYQFFQKIIIDYGLTENDLPDNVTNGYQLVEALLGAALEVGNDGGATAFQSSYAQGSTYGKLRYKKVNAGRDVRLYGSIDCTAGTLNTKFFTLPVGFRPIGTAFKLFTVYYGDTTIAILEVKSNGEARVLSGSHPSNDIIFDLTFNITDES